MLSLRPLWRWAFGALVLGAFVPVACDDAGVVEIVLPPEVTQDGGGFTDAPFLDAPVQNDGSEGGLEDAGLSPVLVGITPNPKGDGTPAIADVIDARLTVLATGSRGVVLRRSPAELGVSGALDKLEAETSMYGKNGTTISFVFGVVDGMAKGLEEPYSSLSWDAPDVAMVLQQRIDQVLSRLAGAPLIFIVGRDVDVFFGGHPDERFALETLLLDLVAYVRTHPQAPPNLRVGVGFSFVGVDVPDSSFPALLGASDVLVASYLPGFGTDMAGPPTDVAIAADILVERALGKPIVLEAIGYPTAELVGGSAGEQALFLDTFFTALGPRRTHFAFVNVDMLHDLGPHRCAQRAALSGVSPDGLWATYLCSLGLFAADGQPKPAWQVFVNGAAAFATP